LVATPNKSIMNAAALVREVLADHKRAGVEFEIAWTRAFSQVRGRSLQARQWQIALEWAKPSFAAAYADEDGFMTPPWESALVA
jgi:hypothetical protein